MKKLVFSFMFIMSFTLYAQAVKISDNDKSIVSILFNGNWQKADSLVDLELKKNPASPKSHFLKAYVAFYSRVVSNNGISRDRSIALVKYHAWNAVTAGEKLPQSIETKFYVGSAYGFLSRANAMSGQYWTAYWNASESENYLEEVVEEDPQNQDAYFNLGVIEYYSAAIVTGFRGFLAWLGGMSGDREKGLHYIERTARGGVLFNDEANYALGIIYRFVENAPRNSLAYWNELREKYPDNINVENFYNQTNLVLLIEEKGIDFLKNEISSLRETYLINNANVLNAIGYNLMNQNRMDDALNVFKLNLDLFPHVANCYDSLAECFMNRNENDQAIKYYRMAYEKLPTDTTATEDFKRTLGEGIKQRLEDLGAELPA